MHLQIFIININSIYFMMVAFREVPVKVFEKNLYYAGHVASLSSASHHATDLPSHFLLVQNLVPMSQSTTLQDLRSCLLRCMVVIPYLVFAVPCLFLAQNSFPDAACCCLAHLLARTY